MTSAFYSLIVSERKRAEFEHGRKQFANFEMTQVINNQFSFI